MTVTHASGIRDAIANLVADAHDVGSGESGGSLVLRDGSTAAVVFRFAGTAFGAASSAIVTLASTPIEETAADDAAELDNFLTRDKDDGQVLAGSITAVGMGGDIEVTNTNVAAGQDCSLESLTYEAPA